MIILYQKNYSVFQELYHSGIGRVKKKYLGRVRRGIVDKIKKDARDQVAINIKLNRSFNNVPKISNKDLAIKVVKDGRKNGDVRVYDNDEFSKAVGVKPTAFMHKVPLKDKEHYLNVYKEKGKKYTPKMRRILKSLVDRKNIVNISGSYKDDVAVLAHEIGHAMNNTGSSGKKNQAISRLTLINKHKKENPKGILNTFKKRYVELKEESNAWKNAMDLLKRNNATKNELRLAKNQRDVALKTYKSNGRYKVDKELIDRYSLNGLDKKIGIMPNTVNSSREGIKKKLSERYLGSSISQKEIDDLVNNIKTERQLYRQQQIRKSRRKDKSILGQLFGNW